MRATATFLLALAALALIPLTSSAARRDPDGRYEARIVLDGKPVEATWALRVAGNGRELRRFRLSLDVVCTRGLAPRVERMPVGFGAVKVGPRGRFRKLIRPDPASDPAPDERIVLQGTRKGRKARGRIYYFVDGCVRRVRWRARRVSG